MQELHRNSHYCTSVPVSFFDPEQPKRNDHWTDLLNITPQFNCQPFYPLHSYSFHHPLEWFRLIEEKEWAYTSILPLPPYLKQRNVRYKCKIDGILLGVMLIWSGIYLIFSMQVKCDILMLRHLKFFNPIVSPVISSALCSTSVHIIFLPEWNWTLCR